MKFEIIQGDCIEEMKRLKQKEIFFDAVVADPPYCSGGMTPSQVARGGAEKYSNATEILGNFGDGMTQTAFCEFSRMWLKHAWEIMKPLAYAFIFIDWRQLPTMSMAFESSGFVWRGLAVWNKKNSRPSIGHISANCEYIIWGTKGREKSNKYVTNNVFEKNSPPMNQRIHPTQKEPSVIEKLLNILPDAAERVLDPFAGSGTTGIAAFNKGLDFIGIEESEKFARGARERLNDALNKFKITGAVVDTPRKRNTMSLLENENVDVIDNAELSAG